MEYNESSETNRYITCTQHMCIDDNEEHAHETPQPLQTPHCSPCSPTPHSPCCPIGHLPREPQKANERINTCGWPFLLLTFFYECHLNTNQHVIFSCACMLNTLNWRNQLSHTRLWGRNSDLKILFGSSRSREAVHVCHRWKCSL